MSGAILRYRVMAWVAGVMSLLLWFVYMPVKYLFDAPDLVSKLTWIPMIHGMPIYPLYVLAALNLSIKAKYPITRMIGFILAGTLPVASFIAERRVVTENK